VTFRDCDIIRQGELLGAAFDRVILYEDHYRRGRSEGEIIGLFRKGMESASRTREIIEIAGATNAAEAALSTAQPGELVLLHADAIDETVQWLRSYLETLACAFRVCE
jgi:cyanophycin synthetase